MVNQHQVNRAIYLRGRKVMVVTEVVILTWTRSSDDRDKACVIRKENKATDKYKDDKCYREREIWRRSEKKTQAAQFR